MTEPDPKEVILESGERLSRSMLWKLQRSYFARAGIDAWGSATVPHYITCNAFIADAYARVVLGWLRDTAPSLDRAHPLYMVELGAGSGRFAYLFLKKLLALLEHSPLAGLRFTYVMTDFGDDALIPWRAHPSLKPFIEAGQLDFARFDVERDQSLQLVESKVTLAPGGVVNPMAVVANYYFDSIPQDVFYVKDGQLFECLLTLSLPDGPGDLEDAAGIIERVELTYDDLPAANEYYGDGELDRILNSYVGRIHKGAVKFPTAGFATCRVFSQLSSDRWLLLSGDKGQVHDENVDGQKRPGIAVHGSFSMDVNYHALGEYFRGRGGRVMKMDHRHNSLNVVAMAMGAYEPVETAAAFAGAIESFGPDDFFIVRKAMEDDTDEMSPELAMALLRFGCNDPRMTRNLVPVMRRHALKASPAYKAEMVRLVERAWSLYFHIGEESDFGFSAGVLLFELGAFPRAIELFLSSWELYGPDSGTAYNLALACSRLELLTESLHWAEQALAIDPAHVAARKLRDDLLISMSPEPG